MDQDTLIDEVTRRTALASTDAAETAAGATLRVLGERIGSGASNAVADHLPAAFLGSLRMDSADAASFPVDEFVERVREYEREDGLDVDQAATRDHVRAVLATLESDPDVRPELRSAREQLPTSYDTLFSGGEPANSA